MKKSEVLACCNENTTVSFKHVILKVGDVYSHPTDGTLGIVLKFGDSLIFKKHDGEYILPENKNSMFNHEFVCNVGTDANMLQQMVNCGYIEDDSVQTVPVTQQTQQLSQPQAQAEQPKEEKIEVKKTTKKKEKEPKEEQTEPKLSIYEKISKVREAWKNANIEKEGHGKAGGGAKYDYYKPQQIIDFCLEQELKLGLISNFTVNNADDTCYYRVINIDDNKDMITCCPFIIPKKMACSEAQQVGAALTYYNRRLAMMLYKIEDNSRESVDIMENADYSAPVIPEIVVAPPTMQAPPVVAPPPQNIQPEPPKNAIPNLSQAETTAQQPPQQSSPPVVNVPSVQPVQATQPQVQQAPVTPPVQPTKINIESLY
jgi:hypothetical protein